MSTSQDAVRELLEDLAAATRPATSTRALKLFADDVGSFRRTIASGDHSGVHRL